MATDGEVRGKFKADGDNNERAVKKAKLDAAEGQVDAPEVLPSRKSFEGFSLEGVLSHNPQGKLLIVQGRFDKANDKAVVLLEKTAFCPDTASELLSEKTSLEETLQNDIYHTYDVYPDPRLNALKATLIYPATEKHIQKYSMQDIHLVEETAEDYEKITLPYIEQSKFSTQWVRNILEKKKEAERIVFEDEDLENGFILLPDMKWDGKDTERLYLSAITHNSNLKSIRDLGPENLPLLKNIMEKGTKAILDKYHVPKSQLRIYFHYQPSYYHLHVHFNHIKLEAPGSGVERAHLLADVISNIKLLPNYYKLTPLTFTLRQNDPLYKKYKESGKI